MRELVNILSSDWRSIGQTCQKLKEQLDSIYIEFNGVGFNFHSPLNIFTQ